VHGIKGFVIPTKSFVKIEITKIFVTTTKCLVLSKTRLAAAAKFLVAATKNLFVVPNFVAVTKPFFPCLASVLSGYFFQTPVTRAFRTVPVGSGLWEV